MGCLTIAVQSANNYYYEGDFYDKISLQLYPRGRIVEFTNKDEFCHS